MTEIYLNESLKQWLERFARERDMTLQELVVWWFEKLKDETEPWPETEEETELPVTVQLPAYLVKELGKCADPHGLLLDSISQRLEGVSYDRFQRKRARQGVTPLKAPSEYPSEAAYMMAVVESASLTGQDVRLMASLACGLLDSDNGRFTKGKEFLEELIEHRAFFNQEVEADKRRDRMDEYGRQWLHSQMQELSLSCFEHPWADGLEFLLWEGAQAIPHPADPFPGWGKEARASLLQLARDVGGWWYRRPGEHRAICVELPEWEWMFKKWQKAQESI